MTEKQACSKCEKSGANVKIIVCGKTKKLTCKDCCVQSSGGMQACDEWKFCWTTFWI